jgi:hypothetical protein
VKKFLRPEYFPVLLLIAVCLVIGLWTIHDYGESWDEYNFFQYARESLSAYPGLFQPDFKLEFSDPTLRYYGAWFLMTIVLAARLFPNWIISDVAHLLTFFVFLSGILVMYLLARRWLKPMASFGAALLFAAQPVLWGHAFINARDIPFMVGFLSSIYFGLKMVDSLSISPKPKTNTAIPTDTLPLAKKIILPLLAILGMVGFGILAVSLRTGWESRAVLLADTSSARDLDLYLRPLLATFWAAVTFFCLTLAWTALLFLPSMPRLRQHLWTNELRPYTRILSDCLHNRDFVIFSIILGLTIGIRVMGIAAFGLVGIFLFKKLGRGVFFPLIASLLLALPIVFVTWPYLWAEPLLRLFIVLRVMLKFPWPGQVLFGGAYYAGNELPRTYLPTLFGIQLTEPLLLLALIGLGWAVWRIVRKKGTGEILVLALLWVGLPLAAAMLGHPYLYDNFRQMLFILPPLFLLAGLGLESVLGYARQPMVRAGIVLALVIPSVYAMTVLHPYEYVYYNSFAGGVSNAFRRYEMDYWCTSFREAAAYLNANAPQNAKVIVWGQNTTLWRYLRPDIEVYDFRQSEAPVSDFYAVMSTRDDNDLKILTDLPVLYSIQRQGATLAVVKYVP